MPTEERKYDLYILTGDEIPFNQDGTRDGEHIRHEMHKWFIEALEKSHRNYIIVSGDEKQRLKSATDAIDKIIA